MIESGESIRTINGRTQIRFTDGGFVALQPNTQYRLEDYNFEGTVDGSEKSFLLSRGQYTSGYWIDRSF